MAIAIRKPSSGLDLKVERLQRGVQAQAVAAELGVHKSRVSAIEARRFVATPLVDRYMRALDRATSG